MRIRNDNTLEDLTEYLIDHGIDESEIDHLLNERIFDRLSMMDYIRKGRWQMAWEAAHSYVFGLAFNPNSEIAYGERVWE